MKVHVLIETYVTGHGDDEFTVWDVFKDYEKGLERQRELNEKHPDSDFDLIPTDLIE